MILCCAWRKNKKIQRPIILCMWVCMHLCGTEINVSDYDHCKIRKIHCSQLILSFLNFSYLVWILSCWTSQVRILLCQNDYNEWSLKLTHFCLLWGRSSSYILCVCVKQNKTTNKQTKTPKQLPQLLWGKVLCLNPGRLNM